MSDLRRGLDAHPGEAALARMYEEKTGKTLNGIALGPSSPVLDAATSPAKRVSGKIRNRAASDRATEHELQAALFVRIRDDQERMRRPGLALVHAIPSGGHRSMKQAIKLRLEGVEPGVPDIDCPVARRGYFGLRIEMKVPGRPVSPAQAHWLAQLEREGYLAVIHESVDGAWTELLDYLDGPPTARLVVPSHTIVSQPPLPHTGEVTDWFPDRNFGFVAPDDGSPRVLVHRSALAGAGEGQIAVGDYVAYELEESSPGSCRRRATSCRVVNPRR